MKEFFSFSKDTVYLDTVFTGKSSSIYRLKVYNNNNQNIYIHPLNWEEEKTLFYLINVDGKPGKIFKNTKLLPKDSLYIFIESTIDYSKVTNSIYTDYIVFKGTSFLKNVKLITLIQDVYF